MNPDRTASVKVLDKALTLLDQFSTDRREWGLTELARALGMAKATTYRILRVLTRHGYLVQDAATARFVPGPALRALSQAFGESVDLRRIGLGVLERISRTSGETALIMIADVSRACGVCVEQVASRRGLRAMRDVGVDLPLHAGASGKALLAWLPAADTMAIVAGPLPRLARATITDPRALMRDLDRTRRRGWAYSAEETNDGAAGVAVPILDSVGRVHASLGIMGPLVRFPRQRLASLVTLARAGAQEIAERAGLKTAAGVSAIAAEPRPSTRR